MVITYQIFYVTDDHKELILWKQRENHCNLGVLLITNSLLTEGHTYQFFVRATDRGTPSLHADVPVKVYIMDYADEPPVFQRTDQSFFLPEDTPIGSWFFEQSRVL